MNESRASFVTLLNDFMNYLFRTPSPEELIRDVLETGQRQHVDYKTTDVDSFETVETLIGEMRTEYVNSDLLLAYAMFQEGNAARMLFENGGHIRHISIKYPWHATPIELAEDSRVVEIAYRDGMLDIYVFQPDNTDVESGTMYVELFGVDSIVPEQSQFLGTINNHEYPYFVFAVKHE